MTKRGTCVRMSKKLQDNLYIKLMRKLPLSLSLYIYMCVCVCVCVCVCEEFLEETSCCNLLKFLEEVNNCFNCFTYNLIFFLLIE
jgi:hypothetical protein